MGTRLPKVFRRKEHGTMGFAIDSGTYLAKILSSEYKSNKNEDGHYLEIIFILKGKKVNGKKVKTYLNLDNPSATAVELANDELGTICDAVGKAMVKDSKELHGKSLMITIRKTEPAGNNPPRNEIDMYGPVSDGEDEGDIDDELDEEELDEEELDEEEDEDEEEEASEITSDDVKKLARQFKKENSLKALTSMLEEYEITKITEIPKLSEDDLESLKEDFDDELG